MLGIGRLADTRPAGTFSTPITQWAEVLAIGISTAETVSVGLTLRRTERSSGKVIPCIIPI